MALVKKLKETSFYWKMIKSDEFNILKLTDFRENLTMVWWNA